MEANEFGMCRKGPVPLEFVEELFDIRLKGHGNEDRAPSLGDCTEAVKNSSRQDATIPTQTVEDLDDHAVARAYVFTPTCHTRHLILGRGYPTDRPSCAPCAPGAFVGIDGGVLGADSTDPGVRCTGWIPVQRRGLDVHSLDLVKAGFPDVSVRSRAN